MRGFYLLLACFCLLSTPTQAGQIALIIDDMGYKQQDSQAFALPRAVTFSILPHTPFSTPYAEKAQQQQREVMLHMPMESLAGKKLGPGALTSDMLQKDIQHTLQQALASVPYARGINNHMGSKLTQLTLPMQTTMDFLKSQDLYFVDSRTTRYSKAEKIAKSRGVKALHRHVFIDHFPNPKHMQQQMQRLVRIAKKHHKAVGIAHPYPETLAFLQDYLPQLPQEVNLVPLSQLLQETKSSSSVHRVGED